MSRKGIGFWTTTEQGNTAHINGRRDMSDETLAALHVLIDTASEELEVECDTCGRAFMRPRAVINIEEGETCTGCTAGLTSDQGRAAIEAEIQMLYGEKRWKRLTDLLCQSIQAVDECSRVDGGGAHGAIMDARWIKNLATRKLNRFGDWT